MSTNSDDIVSKRLAELQAEMQELQVYLKVKARLESAQNAASSKSKPAQTRAHLAVASKPRGSTKDAIQRAAEQAIAAFGSMKSTPLLEAIDAKFNGLELVRGKDHKARIANLSSTLSRSARFESSPSGWVVVQKDKPPQTAKLEGV
ncbi:MAG: hypothetical protein JNL19_03395 [Burkholderiales bacterium]|nr:hypothetical protein [Burkholderiales bacterium]